MNDTNRLQLERYLQLVNRRKWVLLIPIVLAVAAAVLVSYITEPTYKSSSIVRVDISAQAGELSQDQDAADRYINTYAAIIQTDGFLARVIENLDLSVATKDLKKRVSTTRVTGTELIRVNASAPSADEAAAIANDLIALLRDPDFVRNFVPNTAAALVETINAAEQSLDDEFAELEALQNSGASQSQISSQESVIRATEGTLQALLDRRTQLLVQQGQLTQGFALVESATPPDAPSSPRWAFNIAAGLLAGLVAGIALALVLEYVDPTLRSARDLEGVTRLPVLASIPFGIRWKYPPPPVSPDYRLLSTKLQTSIQEQKRKSLLFTSSRPEEGCTTVATYSAMALAQAGLRVLLLDANLARPDMHRLFNLPMAPGLFNFISTNGNRPSKPLALAVADAIQASPVRGLSVLTAGTKMNDPSELLASLEMRELIEYLETEWDAIIIDGSSMTQSAGSAVLAPVVDGVVLVAAEGQASRESVEEAVAELQSLGAEALGMVYCKATEA